MKFGLRLILSGIVAMAAGTVFISSSYEEPLEGMASTPIWKGILALVLGVILSGIGLRYIIVDGSDQQEK